MAPLIEIQKTGRETLCVTREDFNGHDLINMRVWFDAGEGEMRPGKQGVALRAALIPDLIQALQSLETESGQ